MSWCTGKNGKMKNRKQEVLWQQVNYVMPFSLLSFKGIVHTKLKKKSLEALVTVSSQCNQSVVSWMEKFQQTPLIAMYSSIK